MKTVKPKKCKAKSCTATFTPRNSLQQACGPKCALDMAIQASKKKAEKEAKDRRNKTRAQLEAMKTVRDLTKEAQKEFNAYIRERDYDLPCISCGRFHKGQWHASHYRSTGACSSLRFDEDNVHKACSPCNTHLSGNLIEYRIALREKIGDERLARLESAPTVRRWEKDELRELKAEYRRRTRELQKQRQA